MHQRLQSTEIESEGKTMEQQNEFPNKVPIHYQEYLLLGVLLLITLLTFSHIWQRWGNWTLKLITVIPCILFLQFILFPTRAFPESKSQTRKGKLILWIKFIIITGLNGWMYFTACDSMALSDIWFAVTFTVCTVIMLAFPSRKNATLKDRIRKEVRILEVSLAVVLAATGILFAVVQPISIWEGRRLASKAVGGRVTYLTSPSPEKVELLQYDENETDWERSTGCYLYTRIKSGKEVIVYYATGRVVVPSEGRHSLD